MKWNVVRMKTVICCRPRETWKLEGIQKNELETEWIVLIIQFFPQKLPPNCLFGSVTTKMVVNSVFHVWYGKKHAQIQELPCLCLQPFYDRKLSFYPKIFDFRGGNSTCSSWLSCPGSFLRTDQSKKRGWSWSQSCKTQPTFLEIHSCWHRFPAWSSFFSSHRPILCTWEMFCLMSAQTVEIYYPSSSRGPWGMQSKTWLTNIGDPFVAIFVGEKKNHR